MIEYKIDKLEREKIQRTSIGQVIFFQKKKKYWTSYSKEEIIYCDLEVILSVRHYVQIIIVEFHTAILDSVYPMGVPVVSLLKYGSPFITWAWIKD